jgi:hypothetical protein
MEHKKKQRHIKQEPSTSKAYRCGSACGAGQDGEERSCGTGKFFCSSHSPSRS